MRTTKLILACAIAAAIASIAPLHAQVQTIVPEPVPGAKPVVVEHIKIHGAALEGNLEGEVVDRDAIVYLPPSYAKDKKRRYRTIPDRQSRGLAGHSMGGYGASRIGMKHPDVFGALYIMSPCCLSSMAGGGPGTADEIKARAVASEKKVAAAKSPGDLAAQSPGFQAAQYATAAAWAPDPKNPPLYFDLPTKDGVPVPEILAKYTANSPLAFVDQYIGNLKQYRAISMDVGDQDGLRFDATKLHEIFDKYGIANTFEIYSGTHTSAVADRFQNHVMPFFSKNLCFTQGCR
jgi:S-formylglutathione hydrolase FrmB